MSVNKSLHILLHNSLFFNTQEFTLDMASKYQVIDIVGSVPLLGEWRIWVDRLYMVTGLPYKLWEVVIVIRGKSGKKTQKA
jgi:hypothetical protein